jgi:serine protease Do
MKKRRYIISRKGAAIVLTFCITASSAFGFAGGMAAAGYYDETSATTAVQQLLLDSNGNTASKLAAMSSESGTALAAADIASMTTNSVVEITTETVTTDSRMQQYITNGAGSGVIMSQDGYIITNNHVIDGANKITVRLKDGTAYSATLVGTDSKTDVAVLKVKTTGLTPAVIGDSDSLRVGDTAIAIGNPLGQLGGTVTEGIISALDRELIIDGKTMRLMQTDAAINPGNSGGGLFNNKGELIGVVVAKSSGSDVEGLGFVIPVNTAKSVAAELVQYGYVKGRIDTGMTFVDLTQAQKALLYGVSQLGVYVKSVESGSNAAGAGFKAGDMIAYVGGTKITSGTGLTQALEKYKVGDTVKITVVRNGNSGQLSLKLGEYMPD